MEKKDRFKKKTGGGKKNTMENEQESKENGMKTWLGGEKEDSVWTILFLFQKKNDMKRQRKWKNGKWKIHKKKRHERSDPFKRKDGK